MRDKRRKAKVLDSFSAPVRRAILSARLGSILRLGPGESDPGAAAKSPAGGGVAAGGGWLAMGSRDLNRPADHFFGILGGGILVLPQERALDFGVTLRSIPSTEGPFVGRR